MQNFGPYDNPFWGKSNLAERREKEKEIMPLIVDI
jgi:hypothetical protein